MIEANNDEVICPKCVHQFRAIPVNVQEELAVLRKAARKYLAAPEQSEPVLWITPDGEGFRIRFTAPAQDVPLGWDPLYTSAPQLTKLTDEEIMAIAKLFINSIGSDWQYEDAIRDNGNIEKFARAVLAAQKAKK